VVTAAARAAAVAVGQIRQTIAPSNTSRYSSLIGNQSNKAASTKLETAWISNSQPCQGLGINSRTEILQKVKSNCAKIKKGVRYAIKVYMNGFVGSRKVTLAKTKYPIAPANMEIGSVHVLKNFNITPILLIRDAK